MRIFHDKHKHRLQSFPTATKTSAGPLVQRKCACGGSASPNVHCDKCADVTLQRSTRGKAPATAPAIAKSVIASSGEPLDARTRALWEPRFGFDFSTVRIHADEDAARAASALSARAYTVGRHIGFAANAYSTRTLAGQSLIAHELAHVVQQRAAPVNLQRSLEVGACDDPREREADALASRAGTGLAASAGAMEEPTILRRGDPIAFDLVPVTPAGGEDARKLGVELPTVSPETWRISGGVADNAGAPLSDAEKIKIEAILKNARIDPGAPGSVRGAKFLLHDTAASVSAKKIAAEKAQGRGPLGLGVAAWVPRARGATIARPDFYETKRPSTSEFEKVADLIERSDREREMRKVWSATQPAERSAAITRALAGLGLTADEIKAETKTAEDRLTAGAKGMIMTAGAWAVGEICGKVSSAGVESVATAGKEEELSDACSALSAYHTARAGRVGSIVSVEIVQESGLRNREGNQNACNPANPNLKPLPKPAYTDVQYRSLVLLYLRAALIAGRFPEVTTHFVVDSFKRGHCDPRCFDLQRFYDSIAAVLGHGKGSTYGPKPSYGTHWKTNNVWWSDTICGGPHP